MAFLVAAVVVLAVLFLVNLLFTFGVIRRLREHTELLDKLGTPGPSSVMRMAGESVEDFVTVTADGEPVSLTAEDGEVLVAAFSTTCAPCKAKLPGFVEYAQRHSGGRGHVVALVLGDDDEGAAPFVEQLSPVARVIRDSDDGPAPKALGLHGFPAFAVVGTDGVVRASGSDLSALPPITATV
jgi:thiol-disulfide isomerase/thioredoxin